MRSPISVALILVLALQFLGTGCLGTFKSKASSSSSNVTVQISGRASAAPIKNATVNLYLLNIAGTRVRLLANGTTDASGNFSLTFVSSSATLSQVVIEIGVTDGSYTEEAGGSTVSFALDQFRSRTVFDGTSQTMVVTPITEIAAARADALVAGGMDIATATAQANAEMAEASGLTNIISTLPADPTVAVTDPTSQSALYGVLLAGISQFGSALGINSVQVTDALKTDFSDAVFDGLSPTSTSVVLADVALTPLSFTGWSTGMTAAINTYVASANNTAGFGGPGGTPTLVSLPTSQIPAGWKAMSTVNEPSARMQATAIWTGTHMEVWGGGYLNTGGRYRPATDTWGTMSTVGAPTGRTYQQMVWAPELKKVLVWGGAVLPGPTVTGTGGVYSPVTDTWTTISTTNAPTARYMHSMVWTGTEMIVWGGCGIFPGCTTTNTGARYNPLTDIWTTMSTVGAPSARYGAAAVWTGTKMVVALGNGNTTGAAYDPLTDTWAAIASGPASSGTEFKSVWTGTGMITCDNYENCSRYNPTTDVWGTLPTVTTPMTLFSLVWTGVNAIIWGGQTVSTGAVTTTGKLYDRTTNTYSATSTVNAPLARNEHVAVWTGAQMLIWGGYTGGGGIVIGNGGKYKP